MANTFPIQVDGGHYIIFHSRFPSGNEKIEVVDANNIVTARAMIDHDMEFVDITYSDQYGNPETRGNYEFDDLFSAAECSHHELVDLAKWLVATHPVNG